MTPSSTRSATRGRSAARTVIVLGSGLSVLALAAGCASTSSADPTTNAAAATAAPAVEATTGGSSSAASSSSGGTYADGTYTATGAYVSPGGNDSVKVSITLASGIVKAVTVTPGATDPTAIAYEKQFASGISGAVVGKKIAGLQVGTVSGSSLTGEGFNKAAADIAAQAKG